MSSTENNGPSTKSGKNSITRKSIVKSISNQTGLPQKVTKDVVDKVFDTIVDTLVASGRLELRNFGVFEVKKRAARIGRNPKTAKPVQVPERHVVTFKAGKEMEEKIQRLLAEREETPTSGQSVPAKLPTEE